MSVMVLRRCEVVSYGPAGQAERCPEPAQWWNAPNGKSYAVCGPHMVGFASHGVVPDRPQTEGPA